MRRVLAAAGQKAPDAKPVLELNVTHPIVQVPRRARRTANSSRQLAELLYDQAALAEGGQLANPAEYVQRLNRLLIRLAGVHERERAHMTDIKTRQRTIAIKAGPDRRRALHRLAATSRRASGQQGQEVRQLRAIATSRFAFALGARRGDQGLGSGGRGHGRWAVSASSSFRRRSATASAARAGSFRRARRWYSTSSCLESSRLPAAAERATLAGPAGAIEALIETPSRRCLRSLRRHLPSASALWRHAAEQSRAYARAQLSGTRSGDDPLQFSRRGHECRQLRRRRG